MTRIILASASPRRRELLAALVSGFEVIPADVPEPLAGDPCENAVALAVAKAAAVARTFPGAVVIGSDTIVHDGRSPFGKPLDGADATQMLRALRGREHVVATGVAVVTPEVSASGCSLTTVSLTNLTDTQIAAYVASGRPLDKAGAYAIQDEDIPTVSAIEGCYCGVMGLPLWLLGRLLTQAGIETGDPPATFERCAVCPERSS